MKKHILAPWLSCSKAYTFGQFRGADSENRSYIEEFGLSWPSLLRSSRVSMKALYLLKILNIVQNGIQVKRTIYIVKLILGTLRIQI